MWKWVVAVALWMTAAATALADTPLFVDFSVGQTFFYIPERTSDTPSSFSSSESDSETAAARSLRLGSGLSLGKIMDVGVSLWVWGDSDLLKDNKSRSDDDPEDEPEGEPPELWGVGTDVFARLSLPLSRVGSGPFVEYGRLCWAADISNLSYDWHRSGCSIRRSAGLIVRHDPKADSDEPMAVRFAVDWVDFDEVELYQLMINAQISF